jgi:hypothetical protein
MHNVLLIDLGGRAIFVVLFKKVAAIITPTEP